MFFGQRNEAKRLPRSISVYLRQRFTLLPEYIEMLRCFEYSGEVSGKQVRRFRIFSPTRAEEQRLFIRTRQELDQHPEMLLFEGYIDGTGSVYIADRRPPICLVRATCSGLP